VQRFLIVSPINFVIGLFYRLKTNKQSFISNFLYNLGLFFMLVLLFLIRLFGGFFYFQVLIVYVFFKAYCYGKTNLYDDSLEQLEIFIPPHYITDDNEILMSAQMYPDGKLHFLKKKLDSVKPKPDVKPLAITVLLSITIILIKC
jgi:hypothetical protein